MHRMQRFRFFGFCFSLFCFLLLTSCQPLSQAVLSASVPTQATRPKIPRVPSPTREQSPAVGTPVHLIIPSIGINAPLEDVSLTSDGDLATPQQHPWDDAGWYQNGPLPGQQGSSVIDGHLDRPGGYPAVFWHLRDLRSGDSVLVLDALGNTWHFRVLSLATYPPQAAPVQAIFGTTGGNYLNLITCAGTWLPAQHQTNLRLVVYTVLET